MVSTIAGAYVQHIEQDKDGEISINEYWKIIAFFSIIYIIIIYMKSRFSNQSLELAKSVESFLELEYEKS